MSTNSRPITRPNNSGANLGQNWPLNWGQQSIARNQVLRWWVSVGGLWPLGGNLPPPPPPQTPHSVRSTPRAAELYNSICWAFTTSHKICFCSVRHSLVFSRMDMQNEVQLKLNNFQENMISSFNHQRKHSDFSDVTLISEDRQKFPVHRIILSSGSGFFHTILRELRYETHSVIYLRGIKAKLLNPMFRR